MKSELPTREEAKIVAEIIYQDPNLFSDEYDNAFKICMAYVKGELIPAARTCHRCGQILSDKKSSPVDLRGGERHG